VPSIISQRERERERRGRGRGRGNLFLNISLFDKNFQRTYEVFERLLCGNTPRNLFVLLSSYVLRITRIGTRHDIDKIGVQLKKYYEVLVRRVEK